MNEIYAKIFVRFSVGDFDWNTICYGLIRLQLLWQYVRHSSYDHVLVCSVFIYDGKNTINNDMLFIWSVLPEY